MKTLYPVITAKKYWFGILQEHAFGSAGPNASVTGMRKQFWGQNAPIVKCCNYIFNVPTQLYYEVKYNG